MKNLITLFLLALSAACFGQDSTKVREASVRALTSSGHLQLFIGKDMSTTDDIQMYLQRDFECHSYGKDSYITLKNGDVVYKSSFIRSIPGEQVQTPIHFTYTVDKKNAIKKVVISGAYADMAELFLFYWPTTVTAGEIKQKKVAVERLLTDRITYQATGDQALITITKL
jgi:hypothetical protein